MGTFGSDAEPCVMPIYEYHCADCKRRVSLLYQTFSAAATATPTCPNCGSAQLSRLVSRVFQLKSEDAQLDDLADPSSFGDLDENDPKSVARWARKLGSQMGEDLGDDWGEMVDRLEAGDDLSEEGGGGEGGLGEDADSDGVGAGPADL
jgi:putative FmdB family regulatory protein